MKKVLLSADSEINVFSVPDNVVDNLKEYCMEFCSNWLYSSPDAEKYRIKMGEETGICYCEKDFIDYLNQYICDEQSVFIETIAGAYDKSELPEEYADLPHFNF